VSARHLFFEQRDLFKKWGLVYWDTKSRIQQGETMTTHEESAAVTDDAGVEFDRLLAILRKLNREGSCTADQIAAELGVGQQFVEACLDKLVSSLGFPILKSDSADSGVVTYGIDSGKMKQRKQGIELQLFLAIAAETPVLFATTLADVVAKIGKSSKSGEGAAKRRGVKFDRLLSILHLFDAGGAYDAATLAERFGVDQKTIERDMDDLSFAHFPVTEYQEKGHPKKYGFMKGYRLKKGQLEADEQLALAIAKSMSAALGPVFGSVFERFERKVVDAARPSAASLPVDAFVFNPSADVSTETLQKNLMNLALACVQERLLRINYHSLQHKTTEWRKVEPHYLFCSTEGFWYLKAYCHKTGETRTFAVDQILEVEVLYELREPEAELNKMDRARELAAGFDAFQGDEETPVVLRFSPWIRPYIERRKWHRSETRAEVDDPVLGQGSLELRLTTTGLEGVKHWLKRWLPDFRVIEPVSLRDELAGELEKQAAILKSLAG
jgi:predicted DNA-binding transcriptional regulator YafY